MCLNKEKTFISSYVNSLRVEITKGCIIMIVIHIKHKNERMDNER